MDDRIEGALLGTMIGDALGCPFEGTPRADIEPLRRNVLRRIEAPRAWGYTDDSEMMLGVAESIVTCGGVDEAHVLESMASRHDPARGYGKGTRAAFRVWRETGSWQRASRALWKEGSRGNGAAVRVAPVSILHRHDNAGDLRRATRRSAVPTHAHEEAVAGAEIVALSVWLALRGIGPEEMLDELHSRADEGPLLERVKRIDVDQAPPEAVTALGHGVLAIESVPLAAWAHCRNESFEAAVIDAVSAGGDTDSIGAMTGAIAGATYGAASIPTPWVDALESPARRRVHELATRLEALAPR